MLNTLFSIHLKLQIQKDDLDNFTIQIKFNSLNNSCSFNNNIIILIFL